MRDLRDRPGPALVFMALLTCLGLGCEGGRSAPDDARAAAAAFLDEIRSGRVEPAWRGTTVEFKSLMGAESLRDFVRSHPAMGGRAEFVEGHPVPSKSGALVESTFRATAPPKSRGKGRGKAGAAPATSTIRVTTAREEGAWKVERLALD